MEQYKVLIIIVAIFLGFPIYFLPAYLAAKRELPNRKKLLYWNLFSAWTGIGWAVLMILAAKGSAFDEKEKSES